MQSCFMLFAIVHIHIFRQSLGGKTFQPAVGNKLVLLILCQALCSVESSEQSHFQGLHIF